MQHISFLRKISNLNKRNDDGRKKTETAELVEVNTTTTTKTTTKNNVEKLKENRDNKMGGNKT